MYPEVCVDIKIEDNAEIQSTLKNIEREITSKFSSNENISRENPKIFIPRVNSALQKSKNVMSCNF